MRSQSFTTWLREQADRDDPVGDLAREAIADTCAPAGSAKALRDHISLDHGSIVDSVFRALDQARVEFEAGR